MTKVFFSRFNWIVSKQFGFNIKIFILSVFRLPIFFKDFFKFKKNYSGKLILTPCLHDRFEESGDAGSEYFWQDFIVAKMIFDNNPIHHVDIGSRIDGFVGHIAVFRQIEVFDIRPNTVRIPGVIFRQVDMMNDDYVNSISPEGYCDSLSCLHTIEHFGLGRYGDLIDVFGFEKGIRNMSLLLKKNGKLYLSTPIGSQRVEFNANWVFDPLTIKKLGEENSLKLEKFLVIKDGKELFTSIDFELDFESFAKCYYNLAIFCFVKL